MAAVMQLAERVMVLNFGRVLAEGPAETVMRDDAVVEAYLGTATKESGGGEDA
jgi:branched-chain amino acid transport system ATP-binding protein